MLGTGALGGTLACGPREAREVEYALVGQSPERGHLLRSGELLNVPTVGRERTKVAIVGGGVAGLSAAWWLRRRGLARDDLLVLELEGGMGGTARGARLPRSPHPMGAHYLPTPPPELRELEDLLEELGVMVGRDAQGRPEWQTTAICAAPGERHFFASQWHPGLYPEAGQTRDEADQWDRFWTMLHALDRARGGDGELLFRLPVRRSSTQMRALDRQTMKQWLDERRLTSWRLRWYVDYACRDDYGCGIDHCSAFAGLHHFLARGLEETRGGELLTWAEGNGHLIERMDRLLALGERRRVDQLVCAIEPERGELRVHDFATGQTRIVEAEVILWAAPRYLLPHLLPRGVDPLPAGALTYAPWLVANLELGQAPAGVGAMLAWDNVPVFEDGQAHDLGYVLATHGEGRDVVEPGSVITYYEPLVAGDREGLANQRARLLAGDAREWGEHVLRSLERMHPRLRESLRAVHVHRWGHAMIRPTPGLLFGAQIEIARRAIGRVRACATDVAGLALFEEAFYSAIEGAEWALARVG
ncbi:NAD(P)-binding protein [Nannocystaceae bacterium ST9]